MKKEDIHWDGAFPSFYRNALHAEDFDGSASRFAALSFLRGKNLLVRDAHAATGVLMDPKGIRTGTARAGLKTVTGQ